MDLKNLHETYGRLCIQAEIINNQIMEVKKMIAEKMNDANKPKAEEPKE